MTEKLNWLTLLLLPAFLLKIPLFFGASLNLLDLLLVATSLNNLAVLIKHQKLRETFRLFPPFFLFSLSWFFVALFVSYFLNITHHNWTDGLGILKSRFFLPALFGFSLTGLAAHKIVRLETALLALFSSIAMLSIGAFFAALTGAVTFDGRLAFFYDSPNSLAFVLSVGLLLNLFFLLKKSAVSPLRIPHQLLTTSLGLIAFDLFLTHSSGALLALSFLALFLFILPKKNLPAAGKNRAPLILSVLVLLFLSVSSFWLSWTSYQPKIPANSMDSRIAIYKSSFRIFSDSPFFGIGPGNFQRAYLAYQSHFPPYPQWAVPHAHNLFLNLLVESGFFALLPFSFLLWHVFRPERFLQKDFSLLFWSLLAYFLLHGLMDNPLWRADVAVIFWLSVFLLATNPVSSDRKEKLSSSPTA